MKLGVAFDSILQTAGGLHKMEPEKSWDDMGVDTEEKRSETQDSEKPSAREEPGLWSRSVIIDTKSNIIGV